VSVLEDVALPSLLIANPVAPRFVFPPSLTFSSDPLFFAAIPLSWTTETVSSVSLEVSLRSKGSSLPPVGIVDGSVEHHIQSTSTRQKSFSSSDSFSGVAELGERLCLSTPALLVSKPFQSYYRRLEKAYQCIWMSLFAETMVAMRTECQSRCHRLLLLRKFECKGLLPFWVVAVLLTLKRMRIPGLMV